MVFWFALQPTTAICIFVAQKWVFFPLALIWCALVQFYVFPMNILCLCSLSFWDLQVYSFYSIQKIFAHHFLKYLFYASTPPLPWFRDSKYKCICQNASSYPTAQLLCFFQIVSIAMLSSLLFSYAMSNLPLIPSNIFFISYIAQFLILEVQFGL